MQKNRQWVAVFVVLAAAMSLIGLILGQSDVGARGARSAAQLNASDSVPASEDRLPTERTANDAEQPAPEELVPYGDKNLPHDQAIRGRVLDPKGNPVPDAVVFAAYLDTRVRPYERGVASRVRTEADGGFVLGPLTRRAYTVGATTKTEAVHASGLMPGAWVELVLVEGATISGRVTVRESGQPVGGARMILKDGALLLETTTGEDGRYALVPVPPTIEVRAGQQLLAVADGFAIEERTNVIVTRGRQYSFDFGLAPGQTLTGVVHDRKTDKPLSGATVAKGAEPYEPRATSAGDGSFVLKNVDTSPNEIFSASAEGFLRSARQSDGTGRIEFRLDASARLEGVVQDPAGTPVARARVYLHRVRWAAGYTGSSQQVQRLTDAHGAFAFDEVFPGQVAVVAFHNAHAPGESGPIEVATDGAALQPVTIMLRHGLTVTGEVRDALERPIPSIQVRLQRWGNIAGYKYAARYVWSEMPTWITDEQGRFVLRGAVPGKHWLTAWDRAYGYAYQVVEGQEGQRLTDVVLSYAGAGIEGLFLAANGEPVPGAWVYAKGPLNTPDARRSRYTTTDGMGRFRFAGLKDGSYNLTGRSSFGVPEPLSEVPAGSSELVLRLKPSLLLRGIVLSVLTGQPLRRYNLALQQVGGNRNRFGGRGAWSAEVKAPDGRFERPVVPGDYRLVLKAAGHAPQQIPVVIEEGVPPREISVTLDSGGGIEGIVKDAAGTPIVKTWVSAQIYRAPGEARPQSDWMLSANDQTDANGRFFIEGLAPGTYTIQTNRGSSGRASAQVVVGGQQRARQDLTLLPTGTVVFTVTDEEGKPVPGIYFQIQDENGGWLGWSQQTNAAGGSQSGPIRMGPARVSALDPKKAYEADTFDITIAPGKATAVRVMMRKREG